MDTVMWIFLGIGLFLVLLKCQRALWNWLQRRRESGQE